MSEIREMFLYMWIKLSRRTERYFSNFGLPIDVITHSIFWPKHSKWGKCEELYVTNTTHYDSHLFRPQAGRCCTVCTRLVLNPFSTHPSPLKVKHKHTSQLSFLKWGPYRIDLSWQHTSCKDIEINKALQRYVLLKYFLLRVFPVIPVIAACRRKKYYEQHGEILPCSSNGHECFCKDWIRLSELQYT